MFVKHVRRYTFSETESLVKNAGLRHLEGGYFYGTVFPIAATLRLYERYFKKAPDKPQSQLQRQSWWTNALLFQLSNLEISLMKGNRLCGVTVFCMAEKV